MRSTLSLPIATALLAGHLTSAHFILRHPEGVGSDDGSADEGPCGGFEPDVSEGSDDLVDVHVGGEAISVKLTHSRATWLFRATIEENIDDADWERLYPNVVQSGIGDFCIPGVTFPEDWAGERGVISIVSSAEDGQLYQCVAANFVEGTADTPTSCTNGSATAYFTDDARLDALVGEGSGDADDSSGDGEGHDHDDGEHSHDDDDSADGAEDAEPTDEPDAAMALQMWSTGALGSFVAVVSMMMFGGALMI